jgi:hypothetical protein
MTVDRESRRDPLDPRAVLARTEAVDDHHGRARGLRGGPAAHRQVDVIDRPDPLFVQAGDLRRVPVVRVERASA